MICKIIMVLLAVALTTVNSFAQANRPSIKEDFKPSTLNQPGQEYLQVNSQGYARFRIQAPLADNVRVSLGLGGRGGTILTKGEDGFWTGTTEGPLDEGFHYYNVKIDGGKFNDPGALNFYGISLLLNYLMNYARCVNGFGETKRYYEENNHDTYNIGGS